MKKQLGLEAFAKRKLSKVQADLIANSAYDLGGKSKENLALALGGPTTEVMKKMVDIKGAEELEKLDDAQFKAYFDKSEEKLNMIDSMRLNAYLQLDETSQVIVENILSDDIAGAITNMSYLIKVFSNIKDSLNQIEGRNVL